jgi:transposase
MILRERAVALLDEGRQPLEVSQLLRLGVATVGRWKRALRERGSVEPLPHAGGVEGKLGISGKEFLLDFVVQNADATLADMVEAVRVQLSIDVSDTTISELLIEHGYTWKKKTFRLREDDADGLALLQRRFMAETADVPPDRLIFLDECGANEAMTPSRARSLQGERAYAPRATRRGKKGLDNRRPHG